MNISLNTRFSDRFLNSESLSKNQKSSQSAHELLLSKKGAGNDYLGWIDLPEQIQNSDLDSYKEIASKIKKHSKFLIIVGIGGSYLGARAVIEAIQNPFEVYSEDSIKIIYAGHHLDADYHNHLIEFLEDKEFSVNVISKSGTTTEPAVAFRLLLSLLEKKYGKEGTKQRVFATTDSSKGALKKFSDEYGFKTFIIPDDVGGRYSVLTPVGLLPIAIAGVDITKLVEGAKQMRKELISETDPSKNLAMKYATYRNSIYQLGKKVEILVNYNPSFHFFSEWWKQLYGESEGKGHKGIFPASVDLTTDLHSMGQYIQDGERILFETVVSFNEPKKDITLGEREGDLDGLNYLNGKNLSWVGSKATLGTLVAHSDGEVPCLELVVPKLDEFYLGQLIYFFEFTCGISGYMLNVNPFDQPGVEDYKNNMFALLGKKGFEEKKAAIENKLKE
ncbi:MAG: glucose-6-phosphate isomerase [Leptospira sp.]|nr:glucose-6-phosphate isomerase [Leptospira sp.]NCS93394.1 glucose-6-phosphate isomerase [Leptospira sp.]